MTFAYTPTHFDGQDLTASPFSEVKFRDANSPVQTRASQHITAPVVSAAPQDVQAQPQAAVWEIHSILTGSTQALIDAMFAVWSEDRGLAYLRASDDDAVSWRVACRVRQVQKRSLDYWVTILDVPDPVWEENSQTTDINKTGMSGASDNGTLTNDGNRLAPVIHTITPQIKKTNKTDDYRDCFRFSVTNMSSRVWDNEPVCLIDVSGADSVINHAALTPADALANGNDIRVWNNGKPDEERWLSGVDTTFLRIWSNLSMPAGQSFTLKSTITAGNPADGGDLVVNEDISRMPESGQVRIVDEIITYQSRDIANRTFKTVERGAWDTTALGATAGDTLWRCDILGEVSCNHSGATDPPDDIDHRPCIQMGDSAAATTSKNSQHRYGNRVDDGNSALYDPSYPDRSAAFKPSRQQAIDDDAQSLRLEDTLDGAIWEDSAPIAGKLLYNRLTRRMPQGIQAVADAITYDAQKRADIRAQMYGIDDDGIEEELLDLQDVDEGTVPAGKITPTSRLMALILQAVRAPILGSNNTGTDQNMTSAEGLHSYYVKMVLEQDAPVSEIQLRLKKSGSVAYTYSIYITNNIDAAVPTNNRRLFAIVEATAGTALGTSYARIGHSVSGVRLKAGTYWIELERSAGTGDLHLDSGDAHTQHNELYDGNAAAFVQGKAAWFRVIHTGTGPIQKEAEELNGAVEANFDALIFEMDDAAATRQVPYVHRVGSFANTHYHCEAVISNAANGHSITIDLWMKIGASLVIDTEARTAIYTEGYHVRRVPGALKFSHPDVWMQAEPGANVITFTEANMVDTDWSVAHRGKKV